MLGALPIRREAGENCAVNRRIVHVERAGHRLVLTWASGETAELDLSPLFRKGAFAAVRDARAFAQVAIGERGRSLVWHDPEGDELDLCADALWKMAYERAVTAAE
jgi:hypothetical protein